GNGITDEWRGARRTSCVRVSATRAAAATYTIPSTVPALASEADRRRPAGNRTTTSLPGSQTRQMVSPQSVSVSMMRQNCPWSGLHAHSSIRDTQSLSLNASISSADLSFCRDLIIGSLHPAPTLALPNFRHFLPVYQSLLFTNPHAPEGGI